MTDTLSTRIASAECGNDLDMAIELAVFEPDEIYASVRANSAGTKLIYTRRDGNDETCWAWDWSLPVNREKTLALLSAKGHVK